MELNFMIFRICKTSFIAQLLAQCCLVWVFWM